MSALVEILRATPPGTAQTDWDSILILASEQHVLPIVSQRLLDHPLADGLRSQLQANQRDATIAAFFWSAELRSLLAAFAAERIEVIALKGPSLAERIYGGTSLRISRDLDLLVRKSDYAAAELLLARLGFAAAGRADDYHHQWRRQSSTVELHFDVENPLAIDFAIDSAWKHSIAGSFMGQPCRLLAPADELLFLCIHGVRHRFERLSLVLDIALAVDHFDMPLQLRPEVASLERLLLLGVTMAGYLRPNAAMPMPSRLSPAERKRIETLAAQLWLELTSDIPKELDWQAQHDFFVETELTPLRRLNRRLAHLRIAATRLIDPDFAFAARFGLTRPWQVWLLRPFRLLFSRRPTTD